MSETGEWDFEHQRLETAWTVHHLITEEGMTEGATITLDLQFLPGDGADKPGFLRTLKMFGYEATEDPDSPTIQAMQDGVAFSADAIWEHEERTTQIALARGFRPDGWGFWRPDEG